MEKKNGINKTKPEIKGCVRNKITIFMHNKNTHSKHHYSNFINEEENHVTEKKVL